METPAPAMVVVAQSFYYPWRATVNGKAANLWRANYAFQALEVPAGLNRISLDYEDHVFGYGVCLSLLAVMVCLAAWFRRGRKIAPS